jgi:ribosomal protein S27AE
MKTISNEERCPRCGEAASLRPKLVLIDEAWVHEPGKDPRLAYIADLRVDDVRPEELRAAPLEQFMDGYFCERCGHAFVSEEELKEARRRYR